MDIDKIFSVVSARREALGSLRAAAPSEENTALFRLKTSAAFEGVWEGLDLIGRRAHEASGWDSLSIALRQAFSIAFAFRQGYLRESGARALDRIDSAARTLFSAEAALASCSAKATDPADRSMLTITQDIIEHLWFALRLAPKLQQQFANRNKDSLPLEKAFAMVAPAEAESHLERACWLALSLSEEFVQRLKATKAPPVGLAEALPERS